jgi:hypothetical protein
LKFCAFPYFNLKSGNIFCKVSCPSYFGTPPYNIGKPKRQAEKSGALKVAGFSAEAQVPYVDGEIFDTEDIDVEAFLDIEDATVTIELYNGKTVILTGAYFCGEGEFNTKGRLKVRFEGMEGDIVS